MRKPQTHLDLFTQFLESVSELTNDIESVNEQLKERDDYDEITQYHNTRRILARWFHRNGNIQV